MAQKQRASKRAKKRVSEYPIWVKISSFFVLIFMFAIFIADRIVSCLFFHLDYPKFFEWVKVKNSFKHSLARVIIFTVPILIYKILL